MVLAPGLALEQPTPPLCSLKRLGESGSDVAAVVFGCYGSRQRGLGRGLVWNVDLWKAGMRPCFPTMCASCNLNWRGALEGEDDASAGRSVVVRRA